MKWLSHLRTINHHKLLVMKHCFRVGLYRQGLLHDLSKYSPVEFSAGAKYYQGDRSPNEIERKERGYSAAWLHHWIDYDPGPGHRMTGMEMPVNYVAEMFCDRVAASKTYRGKAYRDGDPLDYYLASRDHYLSHPSTRALLERLLGMLAEEGEDRTFAYIRREVLGRR